MTYLSLGAGVQSSALLVMSALGLKGCPKADFAVFADTQDEPFWVYQHLAVLAPWAEANGVPIKIVTAGRLSDETLRVPLTKRRAALPVFTEGVDGREAMLPRQCTEEYKLAPIRRYLRQLLGVGQRGRVKPGAVVALIGISFDERIRISPSRRLWISNRWPLIDATMRRHDCVNLLQQHGLPVPQKSACVYCPFHDDLYWHTLKTHHSDEFQKACAFDEAVRSSSSRGVRHQVYLHRSLVPLRDVVFDVRASFDGFGNECSGHCGV